MNAAATSPIERALALAHTALWVGLAADLAAGDPLAIDLPPITGPQVSPALLDVVAALYLFAELEGGGLMVVAEGLVAVRDELHAGGYTLAAKLEQLASEMPQLPQKRTRDLLFARLFGMGPLASLERADNHRFLGQLGTLCTTILRIADERRLTSRPSSRLDAQMTLIAEDLAQGLATRAAADVIGIGRRIHALATRSVRLLSDPELLTVLRARTPSDLIRTLTGEGALDISTCERRGRAGQQVLRWAGGAVGRASSAAPLRPDGAVIDHAAAWLAASGVTQAGARA